MRWPFIIFTILISTGASAQVLAPVRPDWPYVAKRLSQAGFKKQFIKALREHYNPKNFEQVVELNVLLYLRKSDYHGPQVNEDAALSVNAFLLEHRKSFNAAEQTYGVPAEVIASLLWLESRYGVNTGRFHVASVFIHLLQAPRPKMLTYLNTDAATYSKEKITAKVRREIAIRAQKKAQWALSELKALQTMQRKYGNNIFKLSGSFSGAFGMPQFIPSSYVVYARSADKKSAPDLTQAPDAIHSVAHYLKKNGWKRGQSKTFNRALFKYNNSHDYAQAIMNLADQTNQKAKPSPKRKPSSDE